jgi:hypothetical protein
MFATSHCWRQSIRIVHALRRMPILGVRIARVPRKRIESASKDSDGDILDSRSMKGETMTPAPGPFLGLALATALAALLGACAFQTPQDFAKGSSVASVIQGMGAPSGEHPLASGGRRLEYAGGAFGRRTYMFDFDLSGQLVNAEQVLTESRFNAIKAGMTAGVVRSQIGRPATTWPIPRQDQTVWSYRYESPFCQWFMVGMNPQGRVVDTAYGPDPLCEPDDFFGRFRMRR